MRTEELLALGLFDRGSRVRERIERLLARGREFSPRASMVRVAISAVVMLGFVIAGSLAPRWIAFAQTGRRAFEVATVKPNRSGDIRSTSAQFLPGGGYSATNFPLRAIINTAYGYPVRSTGRLSGGPGWIESEMYDIRATSNPNDFPSGLPARERTDRIRLMLQTLLADRFKLAIHRETKDLPVYALMIAKNGPRLQRAKLAEKECPEDPAVPDPNAVTCHRTYGGQGRGINGQNVDMLDLTQFLTSVMDRPVVDKTGIQGLFEIKTEGWTPLQPGQTSGESDGANDPNRLSLFSVLQEQLGLRLEATRAPLEIIAIDHVERPDEN
jgi:uncharacterized protein (TIGR03435 family)